MSIMPTRPGTPDAGALQSWENEDGSLPSPARKETGMGTRTITADEARLIGDTLGVDWSVIDADQFRRGLAVEFEHGAHDPQTDVTHDDPLLTGKIAWAHLKEFPDYYTRLAQLEAEAEQFWASRRPSTRAAG